MRRRPTVLFYCQHSLGLGHLVRSFALAAGLAERFRVVLLNGGPMPRGIDRPAGVEIVSLAPLGMDTDGILVSRDGRRSVARALELRRATILSTLVQLQPDVIFIELFPFGRKKFGGELIAMLDAARASASPPLVVSSLRDILVSKRRDQAGHDERASTLSNAYFDLILVHADPSFATLEESFRPRTPLEVPVRYTGFVLPGADGTTFREHHPPPSPRVVVSAGGGLYGEPLLSTAVAAHPRLSEEGIAMTVVAGPFLPEASFKALRAAARGRAGLTVLRSVKDLCGELSRASASVSQCGYNTVLDVLRAGVPALVVPFAEGREDEQTRRAARLERLGALQVLESRRLTAPRFAKAVQEVLTFHPAPVNVDVDGARTTAAILAEMRGLT